MQIQEWEVMAHGEGDVQGYNPIGWGGVELGRTGT